MPIYGNAQKPKRKVCFKSITLRKKCPYSEFFWSVFSPNMDIFHAVQGIIANNTVSNYSK